MNIRSIFDRLFSHKGTPIHYALKRVWNRMPHTCLLCGAASGQHRVCAACDGDLPRHRMPQCPKCALPTPQGEVCGHCLNRPPAFDQSLAAFTYTYPLDRLIPALKYGGRLAIAPVFGEALAQAVAGRPVDMLIPMPLHPARLRQRGFNHASEIARAAAIHLQLALDTGACRRIRDTPPQVALAYADRRRNVRGAFECQTDLAGKRIALIDDVMTTGTSLDEVAKTLKRAGAVWAECWVVARTLPPGEV